MAWTRPRVLFWTAVLVLLIALYAVLGFWVLPRYAQGKAIQAVAVSIHQKLTLGELRFNPFTFELEARDVAIGDGTEAAGKALLAVKRLYVNFQLSSLWRRAYTFADVRIEQPYANVAVAPDGRLNLASLVPPSDPKAPPSQMPALVIDSLSVSGGQIDFIDQQHRAPVQVTLAPIDFSLQHFTTVADSGGFRLTAASAQDERFQWHGTLGLSPLRSKGELLINGLRAQTLSTLLDDVLPMQLAAGTLDLAGSYAFSAGQQAGSELELMLPQATATHLALRARGLNQNWIEIPKLTLDKIQLSLSKRSVSIDALQLQGASAKLWLEPDGSFNLTKMFQGGLPASATASPPTTSAVASVAPVPLTAAAPQPSPPASDSQWRFALRRVALQAGDVDFQDRSVKPAADFHLKPLEVTISGISEDLTRPLAVEAQTDLNGAGRATVSGTIVPDSAALDLQAEVVGLQARTLLGYLPKYPALQLKSGVVATKGLLKLQPGTAPGPDFSYAGQATVSDLALLELAQDHKHSHSRLLSWKRLAAQDIKLTLGPNALKIGQIHARGLQARVVIEPDQSLNLAKVLVQPQTVAVSAKAGATKPGATLKSSASSKTPAEMPIRVGRLALDNATIEFADNSNDPNFHARIEALNGSIRGISTVAGAVADIDLKGQILNRYSPVTIRGGTDLFAYDRHTDITMAFRNIDLPIFNPYSGRFAGYAIAKGKLSTELHYRIDQRHLQAEHHIVLDQLEWGEATESKDKVSLPVRLATSLLKDRNGVIDLNLPVAGTLDDPTFRIGPVVWQVIRNILVKAVTAPFSFLGSLFKGAEQAQFVDFAPGSATLDESTRGNLASLAKGLVDRPNLKLDIPAGDGPAADATALASQRLEQALAEQQGDKAKSSAEPDQGEQVDALAKLYKRELGSKAKPPETVKDVQVDDQASHQEKRAARDSAEADWLRQQLLAHYQPSPEALKQLANARVEVVRDALLGDGQIAPERVFVSAGKAPSEHDGKIRLELGLQ